MVLYGAFQDMRQRPVRLGETLQKALMRAVPVVGIAICVTFALAFGMILLVVPGIIVYTMYAVALPVCVVEHLGVFASMKRSAQLTKGYRWRVFGLFLVRLVLGMVFTGVLLTVTKLGSPLTVRLTDFIWVALSSSFFSTVVVVAYHDLRVAKEGIDIDRIAAVFD
jgi:membrane-anchored glycerophosphoryl diester phosphodiesterase (GDPDase)